MLLPVGFGRSLDVGTWSYGLLSSFIQGGSSAISAGVGAAILDPKDWNLGVGKFYALMGTVFVISGGLKTMAWLSSNPLPAWKTTVTTTQTLDQGPPKTKTTVIETHVEQLPPPPASNGKDETK
jgi:hypothetical protein